jgi:hypothetical protein
MLRNAYIGSLRRVVLEICRRAGRKSHDSEGFGARLSGMGTMGRPVATRGYVAKPALALRLYISANL